jgi:hypothetical protein
MAGLAICMDRRPARNAHLRTASGLPTVMAVEVSVRTGGMCFAFMLPEVPGALHLVGTRTQCVESQ